MSEKIIQKKPVYAPFLIMWIAGAALILAALVLCFIGLLIAIAGGVAVGVAEAASGGEAEADTSNLNQTISLYMYGGLACGLVGVPSFIVGLVLFIKKLADLKKWKKQNAPEKLVEHR